MAAMRRVARQTLLWTEHAPVAAPCPACTRPFSHAVPLPPTSQQGPQASTSGWNTLQQASRAFIQTGEPSQSLPATSRQSAPSSTSTLLPPTVQALVSELRSKSPNGHKAWTLFEELDLQGQSYLVPLASLHRLLDAICPRRLPRKDATLKETQRRARAFEAKADLIRLAIRRAGGTYTHRDFKVLLAAYQSVWYGPGAIKVWDEALKCGIVPGSATRMLAFKALAEWVRLNKEADMERTIRDSKNEEATRPKPGQAAAQSVISRMFGMLFHDSNFVPSNTSKFIDISLSRFFAVLAEARDLAIVRATLKAIYGINVDLPGGLIDATVAERANLRAIGEQDVTWMVKSLASIGDWNRLIALFEFFDRPSQVDVPFVGDAPPPNAYFTSQGYDSQPAPAANFESHSHLVSTEAVVAMVETAREAEDMPLMRHYFDLLFVRYANSTHARLREIEEAIGMPVALPLVSLDSDSAIELEDEAPNPSFAYTPRSTSLASLNVAHLALPPSEPFNRWSIPTSLIKRVAYTAYANAEAATLKWASSRTKRILRLREEEIRRMKAIVEALQRSLQAPDAGGDARAEVGTETGLETLPTDLLDPILSYLYEFYDVALKSLAKTRTIFYQVKILSKVITTEDRVAMHRYELALRQRILADARVNKQRYSAVLRQKEKKATNVLTYRVLLAQLRIAKLRQIDGLGPGHKLFDYWTARLQNLADEVHRKQEQEQWAEKLGSRGGQARQTAADVTAGMRAAIAREHEEQREQQAQAAVLAEEAKLKEAVR
ncbi:hypothetical protein JCM10296v2_004100 [Rhodotorula toruloides]